MQSALAEHKLKSETDKKLAADLYERYAQRLLTYSVSKYLIHDEDARSLVLTTIYKIAEVYTNYTFESRDKEAGFIFRSHINLLRNYFRLNKRFEFNNVRVELHEDFIGIDSEGEETPESLEMVLLREELEKLEEWQRILLLMRGQDTPYSEIEKFTGKPASQLKVYYGRLKKQLMDNINNRLEKARNETK